MKNALLILAWKSHLANITALEKEYGPIDPKLNVAASGELDPVTAEIAVYAAEVRLYAQSCYEFVNAK